MRSRGRRATAAFIVAIALTSCSSSTTKATIATTTTTTTTAPPRSDAELVMRLAGAPPAGFVLQAHDVGDTGPSDLAKAARDDGEVGAEEALRSEGFVRGYQRLWIGPDDAEIILFVYQFESATGATSFYERGKTRLSEEARPSATPFTVAGLPAGQSTAASGTDGDVSAAFVLFTTGVFTAQVVCNGPVLPGLEACASAMATDQYGRL